MMEHPRPPYWVKLTLDQHALQSYELHNTQVQTMSGSAPPYLGGPLCESFHGYQFGPDSQSSSWAPLRIL
jgi:uncharacterized protein YdiU (UPF0061 family)